MTTTDRLTGSSYTTKTLFVRNLPYSTTNDLLEEVFGKLGPLKRCFVVKDKESSTCKGYGYVTFAQKDDVARPLSKPPSLGGRQLIVTLADKKNKKLPRENTTEATTVIKEEFKLEDIDNKSKGQRARTSSSATNIKKVDLATTKITPSTRLVDNGEGLAGKMGKLKGRTITDTVTSLGALSTTTSAAASASTAAGTAVTSLQELHLSTEAARRTVVICDLDPSTVTLEDLHHVVGSATKVRQLRYPVVDKTSGKTTAVVLYRGKKDAIKAVRHLSQQQQQLLSATGSKYTAVLFKDVGKQKAAAEGSAVEPQKRCRLIVRNLSFKCTKDDLRKAFSDYGTLVEVDIPEREGGKKYGFGVVQFSRAVEASRAVKAMNAKEILGRPVAVDWTLPKDKYLQVAAAGSRSEQHPKLEETDVKTEIKEEDYDDVMDVDPDKEEKEDEEDRDKEEDGSDNGMDTKHASDNDDSHDSNNSDEEQDDEESNDLDDEDDDRADSDDEDDDDSDEDNEDDDDSDEDDDESGERKSKKRKMVASKKNNFPPRKSDVDEERTVFIRNLSFESMEEDLEDLMSQFGEVTYSRIVIDPNTEHSKGTAFVQFKTKEEAQRCLASSADLTPGGAAGARGLSLDGRRLLVSLALPKLRVVEINEEQKRSKEKTGTRNLHLLREGMVRPGTQAAKGMSKTDIAKRAKVEAIAREKLKNPSIFVSTTRLCVRNIPTSVDDAALRKIYLKATGNPRARITECRIMRDMGRVSGGGVAKSRGFGFINFTSHEDALAALHATNNEPTIFGNDKRLIVEFSLENRTALQAKEKRLERAQSRKGKLTAARDGVKPTRPLQTKKLNNHSSSTTAATTSSLGSGVEKRVGAVARPKPGAPTKLPTHRGPKIRHKARPGAVAAAAVAVKKRKLIERKPQPKEAKKRNRGDRDRREQRDDVDKLIDKYRQKISSAANLPRNVNKWL